MAQYIFTIRKQHTVNKGTRVQGNGSEYFRGVVFSYSFSIYCAAYHGIWCSAQNKSLFSISLIAIFYFTKLLSLLLSIFTHRT